MSDEKTEEAPGFCDKLQAALTDTGVAYNPYDKGWNAALRFAIAEYELCGEGVDNAAWQAAQPVQVDDRLIGCLIYDSWNDDREKHENVIAVYEAIRPYLSKQPVSVGEALEKIAKAEAKISSLCSGDEEWIMSIPARPEHDPDLVISSALHSAKAALTAIQKGQSNDG